MSYSVPIPIGHVFSKTLCVTMRLLFWKAASAQRDHICKWVAISVAKGCLFQEMASLSWDIAASVDNHAVGQCLFYDRVCTVRTQPDFPYHCMKNFSRWQFYNEMSVWVEVWLSMSLKVYSTETHSYPRITSLKISSDKMVLLPPRIMSNFDCSSSNAQRTYHVPYKQEVKEFYLFVNRGLFCCPRPSANKIIDTSLS